MSDGSSRRRPRRFRSCATLLLALCAATLATPARADFDVTNTWIMRLTLGSPVAGTFRCTWDLTQTAGTVTGDGACNSPGLYGGFAATIDPVLGTIVGNGQLIDYRQPFAPTYPFALNATVAPAGTTMSGTMTGETSGVLHGSLCQNGSVDPGEQCDEGLAGNGCCTLTCTHKANGTACSSNQCQTTTSCSAGACVGTPKPAGTVCDVDDDTCTTDACDSSGACAAGACSPCCGGPSCDPRPSPFACTGPLPGQASVRIKSTPGGKRDSLLFSIPKADEILLTELGDPLTTSDYDVCVYWLDEDHGTMFLAGARAPAGQTCGAKPCWRRDPSGGVTYRNARRDPDGLSLLSIKPGAAGKARVRVLGRGPNLELPERLGPLPGGELLMEVRHPDACWRASFFLDSSVGGVNKTDELASKQGYDF